MLISIDPGKKNLAWVLMTNKGKIVDFDLVIETYDQLRDKESFMPGLRRMRKLCAELAEKVPKGSACTYERYCPRGRYNVGNATEIINTVIGNLIISIPSNFVAPVMAPTWKNYFRKTYSYDSKEFSKKNKTIPIHVADALCIGLYFLEKRGKISSAQVKKRLLEVKKKDYGWKFSKGIWTKREKHE